MYAYALRGVVFIIYSIQMRLRRFSSEIHIHHSFGTSGVQHSEGSAQLFRFAFGLESFFCLPEEGMQQFELLSRGSCFLTPSACGSRLRVVGPAHVSHPWQFRARFAALAGPELDWLDALAARPEAVRCTLSVRELRSGALLAKIPLHDACSLHPQLDLAVFDMCDETENIRRLEEEAGVSVLPVELADSTAAIADRPVVLVGHELKDDETLLPCWLNGQVVGAEDNVVAVKTLGGVAQMGLCGGPALMQEKSDQVRAIGMVFARVDAEGPLFNHTLLVRAEAIKQFLQKS